MTADAFMQHWGDLPMVAAELEEGLPEPPDRCHWLVVRDVVDDKPKLFLALMRDTGIDIETAHHGTIDVELHGYPGCLRDLATDMLARR